MVRDCSEAHRQLSAWAMITQEWYDRKSREIEDKDIKPMEILLSHMNENLEEIDLFISNTEERVKEIKEGFYG